MIAGQYDSSDKKMYSIASHFNDNFIHSDNGQNTAYLQLF